MKKEKYMLFLALTVSFVSFGIVNPFDGNFLKVNDIKATEINIGENNVSQNEGSDISPMNVFDIGNDECDSAVEVPVNTDDTCSLFVSGTFEDATLSEGMPESCDGFSTIYQDVWFEFEATAETHFISILNSIEPYNIYLQVFTEDICDDSTTEPLACSNESVVVSNLIVGETYKVRVFSTYSISSTFDICIRTLNSPENDECDSAIEVPVNTDGTCDSIVGGTFADATLSQDMPGSCNGFSTIYQDVWFEFEATDETHFISILNSVESYNMNIQVFTESICDDSTTEPLACSSSPTLVSGLVPGETYKIRVFSTSSISSTFNICVRTLNYPNNDDCDGAINVPVNEDGTCSSTTSGTLADATLSNIDANIGCYNNLAKDVWFEFEATETAHKVTLSNLASAYDVYMEIFEEADCDALVEPIVCGQGTLTLSGLTIGDVYKIRVSSTNATNDSTFDVCVRTIQTPENDDCDGAIEVPVSETTECEETVSGTFVDASLSQGVSDGCDEWSTPTLDVWFEFEALTTRHGINYSSEENTFGIYIEVYEEDICTGYLEPIACGPITNGPVVADELTPGETYKIRVYSTSATDGFDFNICVVSLFPPIRVADDEYTTSELVQDVLVGDVRDCTGIDNISSITGTNFEDVNGIAYFEKNGSEFPFENGIVLTTGRALDAKGPSEQGTSVEGTADWLGDQQLTNYINEELGTEDVFYNATILEFDFTPVVDSLKFNFIFAANEYGGYFQCEFSDAFAFFLTDLETGVTNNLAIVPGTNDPISVVTIRKGEHSPLDFNTQEPVCSDANPEYFDKLYNSGQQYNGLEPLYNPINYKGRTVPMTAKSEVVPGRTYHIKMVIQDRGDTSLDSAVFLEGGSFDIGSIDLGEDMLIDNLNAVCEGNEALLDTQLDSEKYTFEWYKDGELLEGETGPTLAVMESGTYRIDAFLEGSTACGISDEIVIENYPLIELEENLADIPICVEQDNIPEVDITVYEPIFEQFKVDNADFEISYHLSESDAKNNINPIANPDNFIPEEMLVTVYVRVYNTLTGCAQVFDFDIVLTPILEFTPHDDVPVCVYPDYYTATDLTQVEDFYRNQTLTSIKFDGYYLTQEDAFGLENPIAETDLTDFVVDELPTTIYMAILNQETGCYSFTNFDIVATETLEPQLTEDIVICDNYLVPELPEGQYYSTEEFGNGEIIQPGTRLGIGNYTLYTNVENEIGCVFSHRYDIQVIQCTPQRGISPNGDGLNDSFDLTDYHLLELKIFNRDGIQVYSHGVGYTNQWEGQSDNGNLLPDGTYFYHFITPDGEKSGYVQLVREVK